jgi:hypothetical protein
MIHTVSDVKDKYFITFLNLFNTQQNLLKGSAIADRIIVITVENKETTGSDGLKTDLFKSSVNLSNITYSIFTQLC